MTVRDLIASSLRLIGAIAAGETPSAAESADALSALNAMLSSWSTNGLLISKYSRKVFLLQAGVSTYTIGPAGDFDTVKPVLIQAAKSTSPTIVSTTVEVPDPIDPILNPPTFVTTTEVKANLEVPIEIINIQQWTAIADKTFSGANPSKLYVEGTFPLLTLNFWPAPPSNLAVVLYTQDPLLFLDGLSATFEAADGYERAIKYNLAVEVGPEYGKEASPTVMQIASDSKADIQRKNTRPVYATSDASGITSSGLRANIFSGR